MQIREHLEDELVTVGPRDSLASVCRTLESRRLGAVLVLADGSVTGILTEHDIVRAVADGTGLSETPASDYMSQVVATIPADEPIAAAAQLMANRRIRHLAVVEGQELLGVVDIRAVVRGLLRDASYDAGHPLPQLVDLV
jgi:CBS domain-containing protein